MKIITQTMMLFTACFALAFGVLTWQLKEHYDQLPKHASEAVDYAETAPQTPADYSALEEIESEQRAREIEYLKQFEEVDYRFFNGDAEAYPAKLHKVKD